AWRLVAGPHQGCGCHGRADTHENGCDPLHRGWSALPCGETNDLAFAIGQERDGKQMILDGRDWRQQRMPLAGAGTRSRHCGTLLTRAYAVRADRENRPKGSKKLHAAVCLTPYR